MANGDDVAVPDEDRGLAILDRLADQSRVRATTNNWSS